MTRSRFVRFATLVLVLSASLAQAQKTAEKAGEERKAFRESVQAIRGQIDTTLASLDGIASAKDAKTREKALKKYTDEIDKMEKQIDKTKDYSKKMKERGQAYFKEWEKSMGSVTNEELKASANERRDALKAQYATIESSIEKAKQDSPVFWKNLQDLQKYYENDMSADSVASSAKLVESTHADGKKVQEDIDAVLAAVDEVGKQMQKAAETQ